MFVVVQSDGKAIERHNTQKAADLAAEVLNQHEVTCALRRKAGDPHAIRADRPGRPFTYTVREEGQ